MNKAQRGLATVVAVLILAALGIAALGSRMLGAGMSGVRPGLVLSLMTRAQARGWLSAG